MRWRICLAVRSTRNASYRAGNSATHTSKPAERGLFHEWHTCDIRDQAKTEPLPKWRGWLRKTAYRTKYGVSDNDLNKAIAEGRIRSRRKKGKVWVEDRSL